MGTPDIIVGDLVTPEGRWQVRAYEALSYGTVHPHVGDVESSSAVLVLSTGAGPERRGLRVLLTTGKLGWVDGRLFRRV